MVIYVTIDPTITGVGRYAKDLYMLLAPESKMVQFIFDYRYLDNFYKETYMGFKSTMLNHMFSKFAFKSGINFINNNPDIIHITSPTIKPIFNNKKMVVTIHDIIPFNRNFAYNQILEKLKDAYIRSYIRKYLTYDNIITVSNYVKNQIITRFNIREDKISIIPPYISNNFFPIHNKEYLRKELGLPLNKKLILSVSSDAPRKNLAMVKRVIEKLGDSYQLVRVGSHVGNSITFTNVDDKKINKIYNACDMLLFPTLDEGFGSPVVEAFKTGLPVLSSNIDVIKEVSDGAALLVNPMDIHEIIDGVYDILEKKNYYITRGCERAKYYSPENIKKKLLSYYKTIK